MAWDVIVPLQRFSCMRAKRACAIFGLRITNYTCKFLKEKKKEHTYKVENAGQGTRQEPAFLITFSVLPLFGPSVHD